ncbi:MAG TPA: glycoside hydrolase family 99-like domain-containing protein [Stenotrophomonas sp.]|nr:glycoside hydrolase family 99-like domain-containing protein [Stenotrophomonas sp.]
MPAAPSFGRSARSTLYRALRAAFRLLPLDDGTRDRLRARLLPRVADWVPPPPRGQLAQGSHARRPYLRSDQPAIGHVPYRKQPLPEVMPATLVAFYLPQFHPIAENDRWWGKGFTEWRNVTRALPQFEGHVQPRLPADLGFYDLRDIGVMREQARLAAEYGIGAFCFYFYWFAGRTLLEQPLQQWLADETIELPFCLCWANENWARRWDGRDQDVLMAQQHSAEDDLAFIAHIAPYLRDRRALRVDGRPMLLVYRPSLMPDPAATAQRWRQWCRDNEIGEIHLAYVQGFERPDPRDIGFDAAVEFPPNMSSPPSVASAQTLINPDFAGEVLDWRVLAQEAASRPLPGYRLYPGVNPGWDNEPRRSGKGRVLLHASPRAFGDWLRQTIHQRLAAEPPAHKLVFINAWNEWAEGAVLEPDMRLGHAWLAQARRALSPASAASAERSLAVVVHAWYLEALPVILRAWHASGLGGRLIITTSPTLAKQVQELLEVEGVRAELSLHDNHGRDVLPFLHLADALCNEGVELVLKLHTKQSTHREDGAQWLAELLSALLPPRDAQAIADAFDRDPTLGLVAPAGHLLPVANYLGGNGEALDYLGTRLGVATRNPGLSFASGTMFWARLQALRPILDAHLYPAEFENERGQIDGTLAHAMERAFAAAAVAAGYRVAESNNLDGTATPATAQVPYRYARLSG